MTRRQSFAPRWAGGAAIALLTLSATGAGADPPLPATTPTTPFVWGETTIVARGGWGRMTPLKDGRWLGVYADYPRPNSVLKLQISPDGGKTWTPTGATVAEPGRNLDNGEVRQLPNGDILLTGRSVVEGKNRGDRLSYDLPVYRSADGGVTWKRIGSVDRSDPPPFRPGRPSQGLWEPQFFLLPDGRVACAYANEKHAADRRIAYSQVVSERVSPDGGVTWGPEITLAAQIGGGAQRPGMPVVTRLRDGRYIAIFEVVGIGNADVYEQFSPDGVTWPMGIGAPIPDQHAGPFIAALTDGRLVVSSCSNQLSVSDNSGATWHTVPAAFPELGQVFSWPAIYQTAPDTLAVMTTRNGIRLRWGKIATSP